MNKHQIISEGFNRGYSIAKSIDLVDIGHYGDGQYLDEHEKVKITSDNWLEFHTSYAYECEDSDRQFSPFEYLAKDINNYEYKYNREGWIEFDKAIGRGIRKALKERWKSISWSKEDYWKNFDGSRDLFESVWRKLRSYAKSSIDLDWNDNKEVEQWLESLASEFVNDPESRFYIYG